MQLACPQMLETQDGRAGEMQQMGSVNIVHGSITVQVHLSPGAAGGAGQAWERATAYFQHISA